MRRLGPIVRLQLQTASLKLGEKPHQVYDPAALLRVEELRLSRKGASMLGPEGQVILDVHHLDHAQSRQTPGHNPLSVGFTQHYARMRERFGEVVSEGIAGESLIVDGEGQLALEDLQGGLLLRTREGRELRFHTVVVAHPCQPFSRFLTGRAEPERLKETLRFLDGGLRGFYMVADTEEEFPVREGDELFAI